MAWKSTGGNPPTPQTPDSVSGQDSFNPKIEVTNPLGASLPSTELVVDADDSSSSSVG